MDFPSPIETHLHAWLLSMGVVALAGFFLASMIWIALMSPPGNALSTLTGHRTISALAVAGSCYVLWRLLVGPRPDEIWLWVATGLYGYAIGVLYWTLYVHGSRSPQAALPGRDRLYPQRTAGRSRWIRHPIHSAYCAAWVASGLATREPVVAALAVGFVAVSIFQALHASADSHVQRGNND